MSGNSHASAKSSAALALALALAFGGIAACQRKRSPALRQALSSTPVAASASVAVPSAAGPSPSAARDATVWNVPVLADDPVQGKADALVTIVAFSELESPLCREAAETLQSLLAEYPNDVRFVWKDFPLPFDEHALPAALFQRAVYARRGNEAFWKAQRLLFQAHPKLESADLEGVAQELGLPASLVAASRNEPALRAKVEASMLLGYDVQAKGIPHLFINGTRVAGAQPLAKMRDLIEQELEKARARVAAGAPRSTIYDAIIRDGRQLPPLARVTSAPPDSAAPSRGARDAPLAVELWLRFPCDECLTAIDQAERLERESGGRVRLVFRFGNADDSGASLAAQAGREAFAERGYDAFRAVIQKLAVVVPVEKSSHRTIAAAELEAAATAAGLDRARFKSALDSRRHEAAVRADGLAAQRGGIDWPAFVVHGHYLPLPCSNFDLRRAVAHAAQARRVEP